LLDVEAKAEVEVFCEADVVLIGVGGFEALTSERGVVVVDVRALRALMSRLSSNI
jgi:hypothetical protein